MYKSLLLSLLLLTLTVVHANVYKCQIGGQTRYQHVPCPTNNGQTLTLDTETEQQRAQRLNDALQTQQHHQTAERAIGAQQQRRQARLRAQNAAIATQNLEQTRQAMLDRQAKRNEDAIRHHSRRTPSVVYLRKQPVKSTGAKSK